MCVCVWREREREKREREREENNTHTHTHTHTHSHTHAHTCTRTRHRLTHNRLAAVPSRRSQKKGATAMLLGIPCKRELAAYCTPQPCGVSSWRLTCHHPFTVHTAMLLGSPASEGWLRTVHTAMWVSSRRLTCHHPFTVHTAMLHGSPASRGLAAYCTHSHVVSAHGD